MTSSNHLTLDRYNQQILACQDDAFSFAFYILGDEKLAGKIVREVILRVYQIWSDESNSVAEKILRSVVLSCRQAKSSQRLEAKEWIIGWNQLVYGQQEALLLVDVLKKSYHEAALILGCPESELAQNIAFGRRQLIRQSSLAGQ